MAERMTEAAYQSQIVTLAETLGFLVYHTLDSRGSERGFPDLTITGPWRLIFMELKRQKNSWLTAEQVIWLDMLATLRDSGSYGLEVYGAVRPMDSNAVTVTLRDGRQETGALHQWCLSPGCERCQDERRHAKPSKIIRRRGRKR